MTALMIAAYDGHVRVVTALMSGGANVDLQAKVSTTKLLNSNPNPNPNPTVTLTVSRTQSLTEQ